MTCPHSDMRMRVVGEEFLDSNIRMMKAQFYCGECGTPFRASGVHPGISIDRPSSMDDGETIAFPIVPASEEPNIPDMVFAA